MPSFFNNEGREGMNQKMVVFHNSNVIGAKIDKLTSIKGRLSA